ncbi:MAG: TadE/TadG family type IV pilus assembly protein [Pseudomonadota bacterium]
MRKAWELGRALGRDIRGNVAIIFGMVALPLLIATGMAIDYGQAVQNNSGLQHVADAAALAAASMKHGTDKERIQRGKDVAVANLEALGMANSANIDIRILDDKIVAEAKGEVKTSLLKLIGHKGIKMGAIAEVPLAGIGNAEVVLVLDYSGSMNSRGKYQAMRNAAIDLVNTLTQDGDVTDRVKFGLVPFSHHVYATLPGEYVAGATPGSSWTNCTFDRKYPYNVTDAAPDRGDPDTLWGISRANGYSRRQAGYGPCANYPRRGLKVQPLTYDSGAVISQLRAMRPYSLTHIALGLEFGWALISPSAPFTEGVAYGDEETKKFIVLLTDGAQTQPAWGDGNRRSVPNGEENLEEMCRNIKAKEVTLITIAFDLRDSRTESRLRNCASEPAYFFDANTNSDLASAFETIAGALVETVYLQK